jgi:cellulose synthase/poly-beta-1,6-N-acetylglucosamine synthase-like glycosyltransferase
LVSEASGEILVFSDANTMYDEEAIIRLVRHFGDERVGGVCGRLNLVNPNYNTAGIGEVFYWDYESRIKKLEGHIKTVLGANGAIYAMRKGLFIELPEEKVVVDDFLIPLNAVKQGYDFIYDHTAKAVESTSHDVKGELVRRIRISASNFHTIAEIAPLLNPFKGFVAFGLWSHKIIRWCVPFLMIFIFISSSLLIRFPFVRIIFGLQVSFYLFALVGFWLDRLGKNFKLLIHPYYFFAINFALLIGFWKFISGSQKPVWSRVER